MKIEKRIEAVDYAAYCVENADGSAVVRGDQPRYVVVMSATQHHAFDILAVVRRENAVDFGFKRGERSEVCFDVAGERNLRRDDYIAVVPLVHQREKIRLLGGAASRQHQNFAVSSRERGGLYGRLHAHERHVEFLAKVAYSHARGGIASRYHDFRPALDQEFADFFRATPNVAVAAVAVRRVTAVENVDKVLGCQPLYRRLQNFQPAYAAVEYSYYPVVHNHIIFAGSGYSDGDFRGAEFDRFAAK